MIISTRELIKIHMHKPNDIFEVRAVFDLEKFKMVKATAEIVLDDFAFSATITPPADIAEKKALFECFFPDYLNKPASEIPETGEILYKNYPAIERSLIESTIFV